MEDGQHGERELHGLQDVEVLVDVVEERLGWGKMGGRSRNRKLVTAPTHRASGGEDAPEYDPLAAYQ
jgi:hypothetical protein